MLPWRQSPIELRVFSSIDSLAADVYREVSVMAWSVPACVCALRFAFIFEFRHATVSRMIYSTFFKLLLICVNNRRRGIGEWHHFRRRRAQVKRPPFTSRRQRHAGRFIFRLDRSSTLCSASICVNGHVDDRWRERARRFPVRDE